MALFSREAILEGLRAKITAGKPIVGGGAGTGISAKMSEAGGIDLLVIYNSGRFRMGGRGSLSGLMPYGDANGIVMDMAREVIPVVPNTPVLAGVCGTDPFRVMKLFLQEIVNRAMAAEVVDHLGAQQYQRTDSRRGYRNGSKSRRFATRVPVGLLKKSLQNPVYNFIVPINNFSGNY